MVRADLGELLVQVEVHHYSGMNRLVDRRVNRLPPREIATPSRPEPIAGPHRACYFPRIPGRETGFPASPSPRPEARESMITDEQMAAYFRDGFAILEKVISPGALPEVRQSYEETIAAALDLGRAQRDESSGFLRVYRFQNPHHPTLAQRCWRLPQMPIML